MIGLTMSRAQFECVKKLASSGDAMLKAHDFKILNLSEDGISGSIHTKEVDADFEYRGEANTLYIDNESKHGLYNFVTDDTIGTHLQKVLGELECSDTPAHAENLKTGTEFTTENQPVTTNPATSSTQTS